MALLDIRQRSGYLFLVVMVGQILLISAQVNSKSGVPVIEQVTFGIFSEVQRGLSGGFSGVRRGWTGYVALRSSSTPSPPRSSVPRRPPISAR